jgi:taurine transport system ATP-binding protein
MLCVDQASVYFNARDGAIVHALDRVSFSIDAGEFIVALGASGCGKSTLLSAMAGFLPLSSGVITLDGRPVTGPGRDRGVVFQKDSLLPWKTVAQNVALGLKLAGASGREQTEKTMQLLELVGLRDFAKSPPYELSGGMRQRVGLARALATDPDILLMDEPFGALDSLTREQMQLLLVDIWQRTGKRIFFITHSIDEALLLGTRVVVMSPRPGRITHQFDLGFVKAIARGESPRAIKSSPDYVRMRELLRDLIHHTEIQQEHPA